MKRAYYKWVGLVAVAVFACLLAVKDAPHNAYAQIPPANLPTCPTGLTSNIAQGAILTGTMPINLGVPTTATTSFLINRVVYRMDSVVIGQARPVSGTNAWTMLWATELAPQGPHTLSAAVTFNQTNMCATPPVNITIAPPTTTIAPVFAVDVTPPGWSGLTNSTVDFIATPSSSASVLQTDLAQFVVYEWSTNIGTLASTQGGARFSSGGAAGVGAVTVKAMYGGMTAIKQLPVQVQSQVTPIDTTTTPPPTTTTSGGTTGTPPPSSTPSASTTTPLTQEQKVALIDNQIASQPEVLSCANLNLTPARINELRTSGKRLDQQEFERIKGCFSQLNFMVPSSYAPVAPEDVKGTAIKQSGDARINDAKTGQDTTAQKQKSLRFQGQSAPNSDVLLYVFSEPLVLYAKADGSGNWVYDLVDPLQPGSHEAYAVVETADGTYKKSSAFSFLIQTAQASAENPNGYSLSIQTVASLNPPASKQRLNLYVVGSGVIVVLVLIAGSFLLVRTLHHIPPDDTTGPQDTSA